MANYFNTKNMEILVLSGVNTQKAMRKIIEMSKNPPIIIALHSEILGNFYEFGESNEFDPIAIMNIIKRENQVKLS